MQVVGEDVAMMEKHVEAAEAEMGALSGIRRAFKSLPIPAFLQVRDHMTLCPLTLKATVRPGTCFVTR